MGRPLDAPIEIAPGVPAEEWQSLNLDDPRSSDWNEAIKIFEKRIRERFFRPIEKMENLPFSGFAVMALNCLLIETLEQFKRGVHKTPRGCGKHFFVSFLTDFDLGMGEHFDDDMAKLFYDHIRNGILHQAELKGKSRLRIDLPQLVEKASDGEGLIIDRKKFHRAMVNIFEKYLGRLRDPGERNLRAKFRCKMDAIVKEVL